MTTITEVALDSEMDTFRSNNDNYGSSIGWNPLLKHCWMTAFHFDTSQPTGQEERSSNHDHLECSLTVRTADKKIDVLRTLYTLVCCKLPDGTVQEENQYFFYSSEFHHRQTPTHLEQQSD